MKILVTGAAGFIGSHVVDALMQAGHFVWCIDDLSSGKRENLPRKIQFAKVDVGNWWDLVAEFVDCEPEAVIHLAAQPSLDASFDNPIGDGYVNVMGTLNVIRATQKIGAKKLLFSSTSAVYSKKGWNLSENETPKVPYSPYGISKLAAEQYVRLLMPEDGTVFRLGNVFGPRQVPLGENQVIPKMIRHFEYGDKFYINGDGEQTRDYIYVSDVVEAFILALEKDAGVFNIATHISTSVNQVASLIATIYGVPEYAWEHNDSFDERRSICMYNHSADKELGWKPTVGLEEGLRRTIEWWKKQ